MSTGDEEGSSGRLSGSDESQGEDSGEGEQVKGVSRKAREEKPKESNYTGYGLNPFPLLLCLNVYVLAMGIALLCKAYSYPALRGQIQLSDPSFYLADMKFSQMKVSVF